MEEQVEGRKAQERRVRPAGRAALILALFLAAGAVVLWALLERSPSREAQAAALAREGDLCEYRCAAPGYACRRPVLSGLGSGRNGRRAPGT